MQRRAFLMRAIGVAAVLLPARSAWTQKAGTTGIDDTPASRICGLAAEETLQCGAPLAQLRTLANETDAAGAFRATLVAQPVDRPILSAAKPTCFWQFGADTTGPVVGPLIDVREGDTVEIRFDNRLPQPSTIHWHGLPVPPDQDGNPTDLVAPGASRVYRFTLPAGTAGTYWYHPHPHMMTAEQVFRGLAGPLIVRAADDPLSGWPERHLFVTDLKLANDGAIAQNTMMDWMNGREGQFVLVNGARRPAIAVTEDERWRIWNACSARFLQIAFDDGRLFEQVGTDGGLFETPQPMASLLLAPGERAEILVRAGARASRAALVAARYDRRKMAMSMSGLELREGGPPPLPPTPTLALADVTFAPGEPRARPDALRVVPPLGKPVARKAVRLGEEMYMAKMMAGPMHGMPTGMRFTINGEAYEPGKATLTSRAGDIEEWSIRNDSDMDHPFHIHGTQFQVVSRSFRGIRTLEPLRAWRDIVNLHSGETVTLLTRQATPGERMFHCHILEHGDLGMMGVLKVV
ncbi:copper oxidase [Burkholderia ubonensis]|uniref:Copper oxidase n=1 Tax=Burkholderia ubonensis TaxID=101571 RepID=A0A103QLN8_9BURK|nr:multicopper oxidase family protein [Burkholderia ubonensis]KVG51748.1 copper oxidase [Burkholderia ubonensis]